jgi:predicted DNA-binding transcriptional regulator YafY
MFAEFDSKRIGFEKAFKYNDSKFRIYQDTLPITTIHKLSAFVAFLKSIEINDMFDDIIYTIEEEIEKYKEKGVQPINNKIISLESNDLFNLEGVNAINNVLPICVSAITEKKVLKIAYNPYISEKAELIIHPYYIKEYNGRWFLFAQLEKVRSKDKKTNELLNERIKQINIYAFDRILTTETTDLRYIDSNIDIQEKLDNIIGVSVDLNDTDIKPETIKIWVSDNSIKYIETKTIHHSQKPPVKCTNREGWIVEIKLIPTYEFYQKILHYGESVEIQEPKEVRRTLKEKIEKMNMRY